MSLEQAINRLAEALEAYNDAARNGSSNPGAAGSDTKADVEPDVKRPSGRGAKSKPAAKPDDSSGVGAEQPGQPADSGRAEPEQPSGQGAVPAPESRPVTVSAPAPNPPANELTLDEVNTVLVGKYKSLVANGATDADAMNQITAAIGAAKITEVDKAQWPAIVEKVNAL